MSTETCYLPAKSFRRCIQHHLESGASQWSRFEKRLPLLWSFTARLPDNPDETSAGALAFDRRLDALTVGWEYVSEFFAITDMLLGSGDLSTI